MYESYWQLTRKPFDATDDANAYYPSETHQGAMLKLRYAVESRRGAALLCGPSGTGKSLLLQTLRRQLPDSLLPFVHVVFPQMATAELLTHVADELGAPQGVGNRFGTDVAVRRIERFLAENSKHGRHAILAIDEAHLLAETNALETLRLLLNFETQAQPGLTLVLCGQTSLLPVLARTPALDERLTVKTLTRAFSAAETMSYIQHRLTAAGRAEQIFDADAMDAVHQLSLGVPRAINRLCDLALLIGFAEERSVLGADQIEAVHAEMIGVSA
ncbi:MAG: AAA family ATPase [Planctomycetales bacterium]|nr:AAA family ATPase [Planctomycetales bacterium]